MMIHNTPKLSEEVLQSLHSGKHRDLPILINYPGFNECFVALHPFLKIKTENNEHLNFESNKRPNKFEIVANYNPLTWQEVIKLTRIKDISSLDRALAFLHRAYSYVERTEYYKLMRLLLKDRLDILPAEVDEIPKIIENKLLYFIRSLGYDEVLVYFDISSNKEMVNIDKLISNEIVLPSQPRVETPDSKVLIATDFDQRFTYILSEKDILQKFIESVNLEGFFCNKKTPESWSYKIIQGEEKLDWSEDMENYYKNKI